jgi:hypothetical protein
MQLMIMKTKKITSKTKIEEVLKVKGAEDVLEKFKFPCLHCPMAKYELSFLSIGDVCKGYGIDEKKLLGELNKKS